MEWTLLALLTLWSAGTYEMFSKHCESVTTSGGKRSRQASTSECPSRRNSKKLMNVMSCLRSSLHRFSNAGGTWGLSPQAIKKRLCPGWLPVILKCWRKKLLESLNSFRRLERVWLEVEKFKVNLCFGDQLRVCLIVSDRCKARICVEVLN